jgi:hypothetical protein
VINITAPLNLCTYVYGTGIADTVKTALFAVTERLPKTCHRVTFDIILYKLAKHQTQGLLGLVATNSVDRDVPNLSKRSRADQPRHCRAAGLPAASQATIISFSLRNLSSVQRARPNSMPNAMWGYRCLQCNAPMAPRFRM